MLFEVIATFENYDQVIFELQLSHVNNEKKFITSILECLSLNEVEDLIKLSICHYAKTKDEYISWLMNRNGKYYFNYDINDDDDTKNWYEFKNNYLNRL
jgi:hypothetical protein